MWMVWQVPPPAPLQPVLSNLAACSVDISWYDAPTPLDSECVKSVDHFASFEPS